MTLPQDSYSPVSVVWDRLNTFSKWYQKTKHTVVILFKHEQNSIRDDLPLCFLNPPPTKWELEDPFWIYPRLADAIVIVSNLSVWDIRNMTRNAEKKFAKEEDDRIPTNPDYTQLHDILLQVLHVSETIKINTLCFESILNHHTEFLQTYETELRSQKQNRTNSRTSTTVCCRLEFSHQMLTSNLHWSESNYARIKSQIELGYTKLSLEDSKISLQVADQTRGKGSSIRTVAMVAALFLPAICVSVAFNTSFFNYSPETGIWRVSLDIWILWVATAAVTFATFAAWYLAQRHFALLVRRSQKETWEDKRKIPARKLA